MAGWLKGDSDTPGRKWNKSPKVKGRNEPVTNNTRGDGDEPRVLLPVPVVVSPLSHRHRRRARDKSP